MGPKQKTPAKNFDSALAYFRSHSFDVRDTPGVASQVEVRKYSCGAVLARTGEGGVAYVVGPGCLVGGEIATLVDRGFQKFLVTRQIEVAATAERLRALHEFQEETAEAAGTPDYYNLALGTVSDLYLYDRLQGRDPLVKAEVESH
ncbi:MAG TPA: hypothetical protein VN670_03975 [Acidobacteriaceae bacterium]|nr:hypothetical protein [Acidobacteriaceae bacterium]